MRENVLAMYIVECRVYCFVYVSSFAFDFYYLSAHITYKTRHELMISNDRKIKVKKTTTKKQIHSMHKAFKHKSYTMHGFMLTFAFA